MGYQKRLIEYGQDGRRKYHGQKHLYDRKEIDRYLKDWVRFMVDYWIEKQDMLGIKDTGAMRNSFSASLTDDGQGHKQITHKFLMYAVYVAVGVGGAGDKGLHGYTHNNGGYLDFLDPVYREKHGLNKPRTKGQKWGGGKTSGKPRQQRDWFIKKYLYSIRRLNETEAAYYGEVYQGLLVDAFEELVNDGGTEAKPVKTVIEM